MLFIGLIGSIAMPVSATTYLNFYPVGMDPDNIQITNGTGTLIGIYNTSSTAIGLPDNSTYNILVVPANDNLMGNHPDQWFQNLINKMSQNSAALMIIVFLLVVLGIAVSKARR